jgi:ABC-type transport system involved in multi-copper enzyme maturation permease subunit
VTAVLRKEVRALVPTLLVAFLMLVQAALVPDVFRVRLVALVAALAPIVLGSMVIGHEYAYRTLTLMLAQPIGRHRLFAAKAAVLAAMVATVALGALLVLPESVGRFADARQETRAFLILAPLCGLCVAPALSMLCRGPLAAIVFTIAIPGMVTLFAQIAGTVLYGFNRPQAVGDFAFAVTWPAVTVLCAAGAAATWTLFHRLQGIEGDTDLQLPSWLRTANRRPAPRVHAPWGALVRKELRLHQLAYVVALLYLLAAGALWILQTYAPELPRIPIEALSIMYSGLLVVLLGSASSAEERQLGTLPAQLLQPVAAWQQWALKIATVAGLSLLLALALPLLVNVLMNGLDNHVPWSLRFLRQVLVPFLILASISIYVSSLSSSGVRAMISAVPAMLGAVLLTMLASNLAVAMMRSQRAMLTVPTAAQIAAYRRIQSITDLGLLTGLVILAAAAFGLGFVNHRRIDRSSSALAAQVAVLLTIAVAVALFPTITAYVLSPPP